MNLKHLRTVISPNTDDGPDRISALCWSPNNLKLAVCGKDRVVQLYNDQGEVKDKFPTRPCDQKYGANSYSVTCLVFSPDSTKIAVGQSDNIVYIYKLGEDFGKQKKSITNKFPQPSSVVCMIWPNEFEFMCGLIDGKLRHTPVLPTKTKSKTIYNPDSPNVSLVSNPAGTEVAAGFADGRIAIFTTEDTESPTLIATIHHTCAPFALAWGTESILAGGCDKKVTVYDRTGKTKQYFDYSREEKDHEFSVACASPSGQCIIFGTFDRLRLYQWSAKRRVWEEASIQDLQNFYTISAISWRRDGTRVAVATFPGGLHYFESILKRSKNSKFEVTYVTPSHAIMKLHGTGLQANMRSKYSGEIVDVRLMGKDKYAIAQTMETLIICDIERNLVSEIPWSDTDDKEKFYFDNPNCCMIFNEGEMILVEYGRDEILGTFRTELANPHVISVRINERIPRGTTDRPNNKKLAFLLDLKTIALVDLEYNISLGHVVHDSKIDWLELNELAHKLLFRDRRMRLTLVDIDTMTKHTILQLCNFVQWVPQSDVVVAQSKKCMYVWYNIEVPEQWIETEVKGVAFDVVKENNKTAVLIQDGNSIHEFHLDESRIEFGTAIDDGDFVRAMAFLESCEQSSDTESMWKTLAKVTLEAKELLIAERALCALGDVARAKFIRDTLTVAMKVENEGLVDPGEGVHCHEVQARLAILEGQLKTAEAIFLDNNDVESAISMYEAMHRWEDAISLAQVKAPPHRKKLVEDYLTFLTTSGQYELAAEFLEKNGNQAYAVRLYLEGGLPTKAAKLVISNPGLDIDKDTVNQITSGLLHGEFFEESGDFYDAVDNKNQALECYKKGKCYDKAIRLAKVIFPNQVVPLEEEWGDYLSSNRQHDAATNHYIEAGKLTKALDSAIESRQWRKALQIIEVIDDVGLVNKQYLRIGTYYESVNDFHLAEKCYSNGGDPTKAVDMYYKKGMWDEANRVATSSIQGKGELTQKYVAEANELQRQGKFSQAEKLYIAVGQHDLAISMYGSEKLFDEMLRLVQIYHPEHMNDSHKHVADILRENDNLKAAENHYLKANNFQAALDMYREKGLWEDAYRVARTNGGASSSKMVIFQWANGLGGETAVRLLRKFGQLENCIDFCCENRNFTFALEMAGLGAKDRLPEVHLQYGRVLESEGKLEQAQDEYIAAGEAKEAVEMWVRAHMLNQAVVIAEAHAKEELPRVLLIQAHELFEEKKFPQFEAVILRAEKPELAIELYKRNGMWTEAFKLCREYAPQNLKKLQMDYDERSAASSGFVDPSSVINEARDFERLTEYERAINCYLSLNKSNLNYDMSLLEKCWTKAGELATKFLPLEPSRRYVSKIGPLLMSLKSFHSAAVFYLDTNMQQEALDALMEGELWADAKAASKEMGPQWEEYVRRRHTDVLKNAGKVDQLEDVNFVEALNLLAEQGQWKKCLERAKKNEGLLHHYAGRYIYHLLKQKQPVEAMQVYTEYGAPANKHHYPLYRGISEMIFMDPKLDSHDIWVDLRNLLFLLIQAITETPDCGGQTHVEFEHFLIIAHYYCNRSAFDQVSGLEVLAAKCSVALLRHCDVIPVDRAFYEAGVACRKAKWESMAFVFLNHYLDIHDAIEEGVQSTEMLDNSDIKNTDIPLSVPLPQMPCISEDAHDEVKEWILAASMDRAIAQELRLDERGLYEASLLNPQQQRIEDCCLVTGYPVLGSRVSFKLPNKVANKEDWNKLFMTAKSGQHRSVTDVLEFITRWCGSNPNYSL